MEEQDNQPLSIEPVSLLQSQPTKIVEGRLCTVCGKLKGWEQFHRKPRALNSRDSRCKICVLRNKKEKTRQARLKRRLQSFENIKATVVGELDEDIINEFSYIFAQGISGLLEKGHLK